VRHALAGSEIGIWGRRGQLFDFQWLARPDARLLSLRFTYGSRCQLFINRLFFEQLVRRSFSTVIQEGTDTEQQYGKRISFLAEIEEPDAGQNAYEDHSRNFEHWRAFCRS
jgi:hypothetical protein